VPEVVGQPLVSLRGVGVTYPGPPQFRALTEVNLDITSGEKVVVIGPSGSGKSTLLNVLGLLERPTVGTVECLGRDITKLKDRRLAALRAAHFGFVFQSFHLIADRSVRDNIALPMPIQRRPWRERSRRCDELMDKVGLTHRAAGLARHLSGGEKQRVAMARALAADPAILLCDEPTGNLDSASSQAIMGLLSDLHAHGTTVVLVTHDPRWEAWGDRILRVIDGLVTPGSKGD